MVDIGIKQDSREVGLLQPKNFSPALCTHTTAGVSIRWLWFGGICSSKFSVFKVLSYS